ncbi:hypothetical protein VB773_15560 [Haloarculaceae archaeon H-GB2-1]|nr:hypothetical protein [Haloarculaceae archaeon H-GB1-1]MEA5387372.1 hypothetical protein [Haloarculaceae archaeon H-GB11]MEA5408843.1 hypothetical protein [Haloarculaceae archaeon H-GB2-1]
MTNDDSEPRVPVVCPECETTSRIELSELADSIARHNEQLHDGEQVAEVDPEVADELANLVADELGLLDDA